MKKSSLLVVALILVVLASIGAMAFGNNTKNEQTTTQTSTNAESKPESASESPNAANDDAMKIDESANQAAAVIITYSNSGFSPKDITVKAGETIEVKNTSSRIVQFDSDPHPVHTDNRQLNIEFIDPGKSKTFSITNTGTWGFHNHIDASETGKITVQ